MNEPESLKLMEKILNKAEQGDVEAGRMVKDLLVALASSELTPIKGLVVAGRAMLEFNREEWKAYQGRQQ